jgi:hypothetical protein
MVRRLMNDELEINECGWKQLWPISISCPGIRLDELRKTTKNLG